MPVLITAKKVITALFFNGANSSANKEKNWIPGQARNDRRYRLMFFCINAKTAKASF
jgi:hypothetical protein